VGFGFVLVGGLSTRMGCDKALLPLGGVPMALLQARKLERICGRAAFVGKEPAPFAALGFPFVRDLSAERAALHGLLASLEWSPEELTIVLAADVPRAPEKLLAVLLARLAATGAPAVVPTAAGHAQPLCAAWSKSALPALRLAVAARDLSLRRVIEATHALVLSEEETALLPGFAGGVFRNVNTPEEYRAAEEETD
jgi:molybdopterin-guanine dinucleotide biosynthesis protein A